MKAFKMATHFQIFDKLREFGKSLDNSSRALPKFTEDEEDTTNKARACLQLRVMLSEAKTFKDEVKQSINDTKKKMSFDQLLSVCEKHAEKMREDIENLEVHLTKYGYKRQPEKLPEISLVNTVEEANNTDSSGQSSTGSPHSDKESQLCSEPEEVVGDVEDNVKEEHVVVAEPKEVDLLLTPVCPTTMTKLLQDPTSSLATQENTPSSEPLPPITTTPMIKHWQNLENTNLSTPDSSTELPMQPATRTPLIKPFDSNSLSPDQSEVTETLVDDFPTPPVFRTPGLQRYGAKQDGASSTVLEHFNRIETPSPPSVTSVHILHPGDIQAASDPPVFQLSPSPVKKILPTINQQAFLDLPEYLQRQFSFDQANHLIEKANHYLSKKCGVNSGYITDDELISVLNLGPLTKVFTLLMIKLNYFTIVSNGHYEVLQQ